MSMTYRKDLGLLALRMGAGGVLFAHGAQKLFGWFGGHGLEATGQAMEGMGFTPLAFLAAAEPVDLVTYRWAERDTGNDDARYARLAAARLPRA
ncbi:DoxX family protein, partial [Streptomyces palmae]